MLPTYRPERCKKPEDYNVNQFVVFGRVRNLDVHRHVRFEVFTAVTMKNGVF
jgi:hypothetical protein